MSSARDFLRDPRTAKRVDDAWAEILASVAARRGYEFQPDELKRALAEAGLFATSRLSRNDEARYCPICRCCSARFLPFGLVPRPEAFCPRCGALERHRLVWRYFEERTDLFEGVPKRVLHLAPEPCMVPRLREQLGQGYVTADLSDDSVMVRMDITAIPHPDAAFDVVYCSHVLEHVAEDRRAIRELHRVLDDRGWAIVLVPITAEKTVEDPTITDPEERIRRFGQRDHVRRYGIDFVDRLNEAGFDVEVSRACDFLGSSDMRRLRVDSTGAGRIFFCRPVEASE